MLALETFITCAYLGILESIIVWSWLGLGKNYLAGNAAISISCLAHTAARLCRPHQHQLALKMLSGSPLWPDTKLSFLGGRRCERSLHRHTIVLACFLRCQNSYWLASLISASWNHEFRNASSSGLSYSLWFGYSWFAYSCDHHWDCGNPVGYSDPCREVKWTQSYLRFSAWPLSERLYPLSILA